MSDLHFHVCQPGLIMDGVELQEINNTHGQHYWIAKSKIGSIFGAEVTGELTGLGSTKEQAIERLEQERKKLYESLWV